MFERKPNTAELLVIYRCAVALFMLIGITIARPVWLTSGREFPLVPLFDGLPIVQPPFDQILPLAVTICLIVIVISKQAFRWVVGLAMLIAVGFVFDQNRLQPWCYQYLALLMVLSAMPKDESATISGCRIIIAGTYLLSGLHKFNTEFVGHIMGWLMSGFVNHGTADVELAPWIGYTAASVEATVGLALLIPATRLLGAGGAIFMHAMMLFLLAPGALDWNAVVVPWNLAMILSVVLLFVVLRKEGHFSSLVKHRSVAIPVTALFLILPFLSFWGRWDYYLSSALYSGDAPIAGVAMSDTAYNKLPKHFRQYCSIKDDKQEFDFTVWSVSDIKVPYYPQPRVLRAVARQFAERYLDEPAELVLRKGRYIWQSEDPTERFALPAKGK